MASYKIEWKESARKELKKIEKKAIARILKTVERLSENPYPSGTRKLHGAEHTYRMRVGNYRIIYSVYDYAVTVEIVKIGHRKEVYKMFN